MGNAKSAGGAGAGQACTGGGSIHDSERGVAAASSTTSESPIKSTAGSTASDLDFVSCGGGEPWTAVVSGARLPEVPGALECGALDRFLIPFSSSAGVGRSNRLGGDSELVCRVDKAFRGRE